MLVIKSWMVGRSGNEFYCFCFTRIMHMHICHAHHICHPQLQSILLAWRPLPPEEALELLDYAYQDPDVRAFAIRCLKEMS